MRQRDAAESTPKTPEKLAAIDKLMIARAERNDFFRRTAVTSLFHGPLFSRRGGGGVVVDDPPTGGGAPIQQGEQARRSILRPIESPTAHDQGRVRRQHGDFHLAESKSAHGGPMP